MPIDFSQDRWDDIRATYAAWWAGELDRPLFLYELRGRDPGRREPDLPMKGFTANYEDDTPAEAIVDRWDYELSKREYIGDGFPNIWPNFGAGVAAAFMGAHLHKRPETIWFEPDMEREITDLHLRYRPDTFWVQRVHDICRAAMDRWEGLVQVGMTDLGGNLDVLSSFRPGERLLLDLYDYPDAVKRVTWQAHEAWWRYYEDLHGVLRPVNPGYTAWTPIFSAEPYYMLQCDFCYMIGPDMFDEFVKPELAASCKKLTNAFYHLDGPGQLPHLDSLLEIEELAGVQWVPGDGSPGITHWPEVYRKIHEAGKLIQIWGGPKHLRAIEEQIGTSKGIVIIGGGDVSEKDDLEEWMRGYGA